MDRRPPDAGHHRLSASGACLAGAALLAALPGAAAAQESDAAQQRGVVSLVVENDSLATGDDQNYTSGIKLAYVSPAERVPDWLQGWGRFTRALSNSEPDFWGAAIGQSIFTPEDIQSVPAPPDQHPYAGWLYAQIMVAAAEDSHGGQTPHYLDTYELEFGMVGPAAMGEQEPKARMPVQHLCLDHQRAVDRIDAGAPMPIRLGRCGIGDRRWAYCCGPL